MSFMKVSFCRKVFFQHEFANSAVSTDGSFYEKDAFYIMKCDF